MPCKVPVCRAAVLLLPYIECLVECECFAGKSNMDNEDGSLSDIERVRQCLLRSVRVELGDGRIVQGTLECLDKLGNMILSDATDVSRSRSTRRTSRLGLVMAPGHAKVSVKVRKLKPIDPDYQMKSLRIGPRTATQHAGSNSEQDLRAK